MFQAEFILQVSSNIYFEAFGVVILNSSPLDTKEFIIKKKKCG